MTLLPQSGRELAEQASSRVQNRGIASCNKEDVYFVSPAFFLLPARHFFSIQERKPPCPDAVRRITLHSWSKIRKYMPPTDIHQERGQGLGRSDLCEAFQLAT